MTEVTITLRRHPTRKGRFVATFVNDAYSYEDRNPGDALAHVAGYAAAMLCEKDLRDILLGVPCE
jgi:hypothetical protein